MRRRQHTLSSCFAPKMKEYIQLMRHVGRVFRLEEGHLNNFDAFCVGRQHDGPLTQQLEALDFSYSVPHLSTPQYAKRYSIIRHFAEFLSNYDPRIESFDPHIIRATRERSAVYIYTDDEVSSLLEGVREMRSIDSFRAATYQTVIGLIASAGLRISEALNLDLDDVDLSAGILRIRRSKFRKSRVVPIHPTTRDQLRRYLQMRDTQGVPADECAFFVNRRLKRLAYARINSVFRTVRRKIGLRPVTGRQPRIHDLRHTFAVRRVLEWYDAGEDVQGKLPLLATYMGHAHFEDTAYYLTAGTELLAKGSERFEDRRSRGRE